MAITKSERRQRIKYRIRKKVSGTAERPRMSVFRSNRQIYVQLVDDSWVNPVEHENQNGKKFQNVGRTLLAVSSLALEKMPKKEQAAKVGELAAQKALAAGITQVVFDRNGYLYHGRVMEVAEAARKAGLKI